MRFKNHVVWITGASSGIGEALALRFAAHQSKLILTARNEANLKNVQQQCLQLTEHCCILSADLTNKEIIQKIAEQALFRFGEIDIIIHAAGVSQRSLASETASEVLRHLMEINFFAPMEITQQLFPYFLKRKKAHIVAISSMAGLMGFPLRSGYAAAKHALMGYFETLQTENKNPEIRLTIVSPGRVNTGISKHAITGDGTTYGIMDDGQKNGIPLQTCVNKIMRAIEQKKQHVMIAKEERILWWIKFFIPSLYYKIARKAGLKDNP